MKLNRQGSSRLVIEIGNYVIKIAHPFRGMRMFLIGCLGNWQERYWYKMWKPYQDKEKYPDDLGVKFEELDKDDQVLEKYMPYTTFRRRFELLVPTLFCFMFGLFSIQRKALPLDRHLTEEEANEFKGLNITADIKKENFGLYNGKLVCVDYA